MRLLLGLVAVAAAGGVWAGVSAWHSSAGMGNIQAGLAIVIGGNLLLCLWLWYRAKPSSGDAMVLPSFALLSASMLLGILPRLCWPTAERLQIAGSIGSTIVPADNAAAAACESGPLLARSVPPVTFFDPGTGHVDE